MLSKESNLLVSQIHKFFGVEFNNMLWKYFDKKDRTEEECDEMIQLANASLLHWKLFAGSTAANVQRGLYMISKAYILSGKFEEGLHYAKECLKVTKTSESEMKDFDIAFALELLAFAHKYSGNLSDFEKYYKEAEEEGKAIKDDEDRKIFFEDLYKLMAG